LQERVLSESGVAEFITLIMEYIILTLEGIIALFIIVVVCRTLYDIIKKYLVGLLKKDPQQELHNYQIVRRMLRGLLYSLDFLIAADILKTLMVPSPNQLLSFIVIVVIRILLSWAMAKELEKSIQ
jgi:uncharacterized membrane protein